MQIQRNAEKIDLLTVTFEGDLGSFALQARSVARFFDPTLLNKFMVVWNSAAAPASLLTVISSLPEWLSQRVEVVLRHQICQTQSRAKGWQVQQVIKLKMLSLCEMPLVLVLDAKNHLINPVSREDLFSQSGLPFVSPVNYEAKHAFRALLEGGFSYFGVELSQELLELGLPTTTPYMMYRDIALRLIQDIERRERKEFSYSFLEGALKHRSTEFLLYYAYCAFLYPSIDDIYQFNKGGTVTFFKSSPRDQKGIEMQIRRAFLPTTKFFAVHRVRMPNLCEAEIDAFSKLWAERGLFESEAAALDYIQSYKVEAIADKAEANADVAEA